MSLDKNTPNVFLKYQELALRNPAVEDGNSLAGELQVRSLHLKFRLMMITVLTIQRQSLVPSYRKM